MQYMINGAKFSFATLLGLSREITAITNNFPARASSPVLPDDLDIVVLQSNWTELNDIATFARNPGAGGFELAGVDTSDEQYYWPDEEVPASYRVASGFTQLSQIRDIQQSGGDQNTFTWGYIDNRSMRQMSRPTDQNPLILTFTMDFDPDLPWAAALEEINRKRQLVVMREQLPTGDVLLYSGYMAYQPSPSRTRNENMTVTATMTINSGMQRFAPAFFSGS